MHARLARPGIAASALALCFAAILVPTGCSVKSGTSGDFTALASSSATIRVSQQMQITAPGNVNSVRLVYAVDGVAGGNATVGTIDAHGTYTAPAVVPTPNTVTVTSTAPDYPTHPAGSLKLSILNPIPQIDGVAPSGFPEATPTTVVVNGAKFIYGAQILWNGVSVPTTFVSGTQLVASLSGPAPGTYPLTVKNPDPGSATAPDVPITIGPGNVVLTIQPGDGFDVRVSNKLTLGLNITGTANHAVTLQVNGVPGGNAQIGTAVSNSDGSITYTAPALVPTPSNVVQLTVTSVDNTAVSLNQNISVLNPIPILTSANPMSFSTGTATVVVHGQKFISGAQVLMNGAPAPTTFNSGGQLTATLALTDPGNFDLQVMNPDPGPAASADLVANVLGTPPVPVVSEEDASRFLEQATFGATDPDIHQLSLIGYQAWLNQQFAMPPVPLEPYVEQNLITNNPPCAAANVKCNAALFEQNDSGEIYFQDEFWQQALAGSDELRERVRYALSEIFVVSSNNSAIQGEPRGEAQFYDVLGKDAFGNFRTLLNDVTLNPMMGQYLSMLGNDKGNATTDPDENYAREVMQLFTIGLYQLDDNGSQKLDASGNPIPTYSNVDVKGLAKVFTGFSWDIPGRNGPTAWSNCCAWVGPGYGEDLLPMQSFPDHHSTAEKDFLGVTIPSSGNPDPDGDLKTALDTLFNHPNLPAFFCKQLIQHLVTSNPSPAYVSRVAAVFKDNGMGVRGDMKAVITAILLDPEARDSADDFTNPNYGKVREALLRYTEWARAFTAQSRTGSWGIGSPEDPIWGLGQMALRSPTVFNWFAPGYVPPNTSIEQAGLVAPEMQMTNVTTVVGYLNYMQGAIGSGPKSGSDIFSSYAAEINLASNPDALLDRLNLLLMAGEMDGTLRSQIIGAVSAIPIPSSGQSAIDAALAARVQTAVYLTMASPAFAAQF